MSLAERLAHTRAEIAAAAIAAGRAPDSVRLLAVSKTVEPARIAAAVAAGQREFGENYAQELRDKARALPDAHFEYIGPLQRNKVKYVVGTATLVHSVASLDLGAALAEHARKLSLTQRCLVQVNIGREPQKAGCAPESCEALVHELRALPGLEVRGLMCIPPADVAPRPFFAALRALAHKLALHELSMGMSADFADAIAEGATCVRIGTAIFGAR